jgi:hypothetical protein
MLDRPARRAVVLGPFALASVRGRVLALGLLLALTALTQLGGIVVWPFVGLGAVLRGRMRGAPIAGAVLAWAITLVIVPFVAAPLGRVPLPWSGPLAPRSLVFCLALRNYVVPALRDEALAIADDVSAHGGSVAYLDGGFPLAGLPMLPHLSHADGTRLDLALPFEDGTGSPIGYLEYAPSGGERAACPPSATDLRWDLDALQPLFGPPRLDVAAASLLVRAVVARPRIARVLVEPHVARTLGVRSSKIGFQGCHAARHDDHVHVELDR